MPDSVIKVYDIPSGDVLFDAVVEALKSMNYEPGVVDKAKGEIRFTVGKKEILVGVLQVQGMWRVAVIGGLFGKKAQKIGMELFKAVDGVLAWQRNRNPSHKLP